MKWTTFKGKEVSSETVDHQHLSNTIWYLHIFENRRESELEEALSNRFNGQLLPYRPHIDFEEEITRLWSKDMIRAAGREVYDIVWQGNVIGEIRKIPF